MSRRGCLPRRGGTRLERGEAQDPQPVLVQRRQTHHLAGLRLLLQRGQLGLRAEAAAAAARPGARRRRVCWTAVCGRCGRPVPVRSRRATASRRARLARAVRLLQQIRAQAHEQVGAQADAAKRGSGKGRVRKRAGSPLLRIERAVLRTSHRVCVAARRRTLLRSRPLRRSRRHLAPVQRLRRRAEEVATATATALAAMHPSPQRCLARRVCPRGPWPTATDAWRLLRGVESAYVPTTTGRTGTLYWASR